MLFISFLLICVSGCAAKDPLVGKWEFYDGEGNISNYEFTSGGKETQDFYHKGSWSRWEYSYELKDGNLIIKNGKYIADGETTDAVEQEPIPYSVDGDVLTMKDHLNCGYVRVKEFTNEYQSDGKTKPTSILKSGYVFSAGQYSEYFDIPSGIYDLQWVSGRGTCTVIDENSKISGNFGEGDNDIKGYKNVDLGSTSKIEVSGTLRIMFIPKNN